jgi:hypothetical protein
VPFIVGPVGWRGVFFIGIIPAALLFYIRLKAEEPERWVNAKRRLGCELNMRNSLQTILDRDHRRDTLILAVIMVPVITGLYGGTLFVPTALTALHETTHAAIKTSYLIAIKSGDLPLFLVLLVLLGIGGADFAIFSLWLPEVSPHPRPGGRVCVRDHDRPVCRGRPHLRHRRPEHRRRPRHLPVAHRHLLHRRPAAAAAGPGGPGRAGGGVRPRAARAQARAGSRSTPASTGSA